MIENPRYAKIKKFREAKAEMEPYESLPVELKQKMSKKEYEKSILTSDDNEFTAGRMQCVLNHLELCQLL